ncbi:MAG: hypothetical protein A3F68_08665 [Acidobacteria bacterium RIFCSPLOWO2_12_FULL_54_10]|nr:MAG: hypothetical protein A3F68_08665 [Acidobacteria bacterium RIFCSPLOWO2_12_FULL_54_10]
MSDILDQLTKQYAAALHDFLAVGGEAALRRAYELGRQAIADRVGVLEMFAIHSRLITTTFAVPVPREPAMQISERAAAFFAECLSPFEMALGGYQEANESLRVKVEQIQAAEKEAQLQNQELVAAYRSVEMERRRYQELFDFAPDAYLITDLGAIIQEANTPAAALLQRHQDLLVGESLSSFVVEEELQSFLGQLARLRNGEPEKLEFWQLAVQRPNGRSIPVSLTVGIVRDPHGVPVGLRCLLRDITERKRLEEERSQLRVREHLARTESEAAQRLKFLAEASTALTGSLDYESIPANIARLAVPHLADGCFVHLTDDSMAIRHFAAAHKDSGKAEFLEGLQSHKPQRELPPPVAEVLRRGRPEIILEISDAWLEGFAGGPEDFKILRNMNFTSALVVPLITPGRLLGAITLGSAASNRLYTAEDVALADVFARRCALVLENARLYQQVVIERDKAERASQAKEEFVAVLSHELRTPLMAILGWARLLNRQPQIMTNKDLGDGIRSLEHNAQTIARLVDDCLDVARISEGKIKLQRELVDLNQVAKAASAATGEMAHAKRIRFAIHSSGSSLTVSGDKTRLEQVLLNLLTNAIKYTERGGEISVNLRQAGKEGEIEVRDTGIGIDPDFIEQIFQPFGQGTMNWFASESGLGLGLAIAREIVQMHGGRIWAESSGRGRGSTFRLQLPLTPVAVLQKDVGSQQLSVLPEVKPLRILFVEDSRDVLNLLRIELEALGYSVLMAADGESGLEIAKRELPDVLVSDIKMPRFDGYQLIEQVRRIPQLAAIPAIALTGFGRSKDVEKALHAGYNAHLCKPVELNELIAVIQKLASV